MECPRSEGGERKRVGPLPAPCVVAEEGRRETQLSDSTGGSDGSTLPPTPPFPSLRPLWLCLSLTLTRQRCLLGFPSLVSLFVVVVCQAEDKWSYVTSCYLLSGENVERPRWCVGHALTVAVVCWTRPDSLGGVLDTP